MLEYGLTGDNQQFFHNYLKVTREKLQYERNNYRIFNKKVRNLTAIIIFGIIASATVLTINLLEIYAATWFFWFGIVGVVIAVAIGILLFFCLKENYNEIKLIDHAVEVYDLNEERNFSDPKTKEVLNKIEINTNRASDYQISLLKSNVTISNGEKLQ